MTDTKPKTQSQKGGDLTARKITKSKLDEIFSKVETLIKHKADGWEGYHSRGGFNELVSKCKWNICGMRIRY